MRRHRLALRLPEPSARSRARGARTPCGLTAPVRLRPPLTPSRRCRRQVAEWRRGRSRGSLGLGLLAAGILRGGHPPEELEVLDDDVDLAQPPALNRAVREPILPSTHTSRPLVAYWPTTSAARFQRTRVSPFVTLLSRLAGLSGRERVSPVGR